MNDLAAALRDLAELVEKLEEVRSLQLQRALLFPYAYGGTDEIHHLRWILDQMVRVLTGDRYDEWVRERTADGYSWDVGIPP